MSIRIGSPTAVAVASDGGLKLKLTDEPPFTVVICWPLARYSWTTSGVVYPE